LHWKYQSLLGFHEAVKRETDVKITSIGVSQNFLKNIDAHRGINPPALIFGVFLSFSTRNEGRDLLRL
jgi:hypothetical protein